MNAPLVFNEQTSSVNNIRLLPIGSLVWFRINVRAIKLGKDSGARYADLELQIAHGEHTGHKFWTNISDPTPKAALPPNVEEGSEGARRMGYGAIARLLEAGGLVRVGDPASYNAVGGTFEQIMQRLHGQAGACEVGIEPGKGAFPDKNVVKEFLSPNPQSGGYKLWTALLAGATMNPNAKPVPGTTPPIPAAASWGGGAPAAAPQPAAPAPAFAPPAASPAMPASAPPPRFQHAAPAGGWGPPATAHAPHVQPAAPIPAQPAPQPGPAGFMPPPAVAPGPNLDKPAAWLAQANG